MSASLGSAGVPPAQKRQKSTLRRGPNAPQAGETPALPGALDASGWFSRGYVPHFDAVGMVQHVTFYLADSLPRAVVEKIDRELSDIDERQRDQEKRRRFECYMDSGYGSCALRRPELASLMEEALQYGDGDRYRLIAWVVMPNHCHVLIQLNDRMTLSRIVHSWKSFTGHSMKKLVGNAGETAMQPGFPGWQRDYWDRYIRDENHFYRAVDYVQQNPVKAGLCSHAREWPFSSARFQKVA